MPVEQFTQRLSRPVQPRLHRGLRHAEGLGRRRGVKFFDVPQQNDVSVLVGKFVDFSPDQMAEFGPIGVGRRVVGPRPAGA
jgi:hypothetical protein